MGYTKLFSEIVMSTIWREPHHVRVVWITMLAIKDRWHVVNSSLPGLADAARVTIEECEDALRVLSSPDPYSRSRDFDGRRIEPCDGGWIILNGEKYRNKMSLDERREYQRIKQREYREMRKSVKSCLQSSQQKTHTDTDTDTKNNNMRKSADLRFSEFWEKYPRKVDKKRAERAFKNLTKTKQLQAIKDCERRYEKVEKKYIPYPTTYLHAERWEDELQKEEPYGADGI